MTLAGLLFGGGMLVGSLGLYYHQLYLLYFGYGVLSGCGIGVAYTPPIQALLKWFPDRKGIASGFTIAGFGSGALLFTPIAQNLMKKFAILPTYLGKQADLKIENREGVLFTEFEG